MEIGITPFGAFLVENGKIVKYTAFDDPESVMDAVEKGEIPEHGLGDYPVKRPEEVFSSFEHLAEITGFAATPQELSEKLCEIQLKRVRKQISGKSKADRLLIQVSSAISDLDRVINSLSERLREWYTLHYPEFAATTKDPEKIVNSVRKFGRRENFPDFTGSMGEEFTEADEKAVRDFAEKIHELETLRSELEKYLDSLASKVIPNLKAVAGTSLASKLLAAAGSLEKLSKMPSSVIQLLGAEKSLFRHLKKGTKPPKHGIIYLHPDVSGAPKDLRGRVARLLSSKIAIAARADRYTGENISEKLMEEYRKKLGEILENK
ncbi:MAG: hypothetical protein GXO63_03310 [Candidatus Micrarchaeota archaeon]|nr:hypothetical protein [Candidatus Micrarchaeota archaeon]